MMQPEVKALIEHYSLEPLPVEQTLFTRTYRSHREFGDGKPLGTAIIGLYCDEPRSVSLFHKLTVDEVWHFYAGDPLRLILLYPDGSSKDVIMGNDPLKGHIVQFVVSAGVWQAGQMVAGGIYSLFGCTMAPGFTNDMFEGGTRDQLVDDYPDKTDDINMLACNPDETSMPTGSAS
jgi:predicted cupin superfamily sugar epimerase